MTLEPDQKDKERSGLANGEPASPSPPVGDELDAAGDPEAKIDESLVDEVAALLDNARNYAEAELAFQKTRAGLTGANVAATLAFIIVAIILLHIAIIALAVGFVIALEPLVSIWGAIAIVVGALLIGTGVLIWSATGRVRRIAAMFANSDDEQASESSTPE